MKIFFNKKIISTLLIMALILPMLSIPQKARAVIPVQEVGTNLVQSIITAGQSTATAASALSLEFKDYVLDGLATGFAKMIIRQITSSVVNWINSGFEGSPSFLQNPGAFFLDVADQITGDFIAKSNGPLSQLCSPFSIDIRIALAFKYRPNIPKRYTCTLSTIIKNTKNAVEGASINGFTAGDFKQGGWPAFVSLTTEPQNNIYGAYLTAESDLSWRVANAQSQQRDEISNGKGFLSWRDPKCTSAVKKYNATIDRSKDNENTAIGNYNARSVDATEDTVIAAYNEGSLTPVIQSVNDCPIQTPGSVISGTLQNNLNGPLRELELADEINEIVNALFAQLVTQVLQKGLGAVSSKGSDGKSYLDKTITELNSEANPQLQSTKAELLKNTGMYKKNTLEYKKYRDEALAIMLSIKNGYDSAKACYVTKQTSQPRNRNSQNAQAAILEIDSILSTKVTAKTLNLFTAAKEADDRLKVLQDIENAANAAKTLNDLNAPSQKYSQMIQGRELITVIDIQKAKEELELIKTESYDLQQDALRKVQACQIY